MADESIPWKIVFILLGAINGAAATGAVDLYIQKKNRTQEAASLRAAFAGEVAALVEIARGLEIDDDLEEVIESINKNKKVERVYLTVKQDYFRVYKGNIAKLGLLDTELAEEICTFYTYCFAAIEYMNELSTTEWAKGINMPLALKQIQRLRKLLDIAINSGTKLIEKLNTQV